MGGLQSMMQQVRQPRNINTRRRTRLPKGNLERCPLTQLPLVFLCLLVVFQFTQGGGFPGMGGAGGAGGMDMEALQQMMGGMGGMPGMGGGGGRR